VLRVPSRRIPFDPEDRLMRRRHLLRLPELRRERFDLVHIQTPFVAHYAGLRLARELGIPQVETYHTFFEEYLYNYVPLVPRAWLKAAARRFSRSQCNSVDAVVVPSVAMRDALVRYGVESRMEIIPTGMDTERFRGGDGSRFRARFGIAPDRPVLVFVGRVAHEKNIDFLLHMVDQLRHQVPDVLLIVAGEGPAQAHLRHLAARLGIETNVLFVGYLDRDSELLDCYRAGDLFVFASRTETQGLVLLEAMALGVPVVSTAVMGTRDILAPGLGCVVAEEDVHDFADKVAQTLRDGPRRTQLAGEAREYAEQWSARALAERMLGLYGELI
jgi:1,2-diacylglycerol 3-alpha-glucosyltransferase